MKFFEKYRWLTPERLAILFLSAIVLLVFGQTIGFRFVNYDDPLYVGLLGRTQFSGIYDRLHWAFTHMESGDWQPFVWLSWMLDQRIYGLDPAGFHLTNVILHLLVVTLFFVFWRLATNRVWLAFIAAAFFAIHPLRVESVAWVAERKDLLSAFWMMLTLIAYFYYTVRSDTSFKKVIAYWVTLFFFICGLLTKPMLVTLPLLMLVLDYWPLGRFQVAGGREQGKKRWGGLCRMACTLVLEKLPFFLLISISIFFTLEAIQNIYPFMPLDPLPLSYRIETAIYGYWDFIWNLFYPYQLTFFYPRPLEYNPIEIFSYAAGLITISFLTILFIKKKPYLFMGWAWFVISLGPVSGIVRMGSAYKADRYTYFAHMGLLILVVWLVSDLMSRWKQKRSILIPILAMLLFAYGFSAFDYTKSWRNARTLNQRGVDVSEENYRALNNLGVLYMDNKEYSKALKLFEKTIEVYPEFWKGYRNIGMAHFFMGNDVEAFTHLKKAVKRIPDDPELHHRLASLYAKQGKTMLAIAHYEISLKFNKSPTQGVFYLLGNLYRKINKLEEAADYYKQSLQIAPEFASAHNNLANIYLMMGQKDLARSHYMKTIELQPGHENAVKTLKKLENQEIGDKKVVEAL